jgi:hypothetical protein
MYFLLQGNPSMGSMESMGCAEAKKQLFVKTAMFKVCTVPIYLLFKNWFADFSSGVKSYFLNICISS